MGRKHKSRWGALAWPGICRATASALTDESRRLGGLSMRAESIGAIGPRDELGAEAVACRDYAAILAAGERIWVSADMVTATTDAAADVPSLDTIDMPEARGCLGLAEPLPLIDLGHPLWLRTPDGGTREHTEPISVDALAWTTIGASVRVVLMTRTQRLPAPLHGTDSPLSAVESMAVPARMDFEDMEARRVQPGGAMGQLSPERVRPMLRVASWLSAAWVLMATPTVAEPRPMDGRWGGPVTRQTRPRDRVTVIDMRPVRQVHTTTDPTGRRLTTRHVVRGHWTHQPYGPRRSQRRLQWIAPFIRGPEGAPFVGTDTVRVWRR